jgi:hypothetical protein
VPFTRKAGAKPNSERAFPQEDYQREAKCFASLYFRQERFSDRQLIIRSEAARGKRLDSMN